MKRLFVLLLLIVQSCYLIPCTFNSDLDNINEKVKKQDVIGTYKVEKRTIGYVDGYESGNAYIELKDDGSLVYSNITERTIDILKFENKLIKGIGSWKLQNNEVHFSIQDRGSSWDLFQKNDQYVLSHLYGDPDSCTFVRFIKTKS